MSEHLGPKPPKPTTKAERRELMERQMAAKELKKKQEAEGKGLKPAGPTSEAPKASTPKPRPDTGADPAKAAAPPKVTVPTDSAKAIAKPTPEVKQAKVAKPGVPKPVTFFSHLRQFEHSSTLSKDLTGIHPAILRLGLKYAEGHIKGSNSRVIALLAALKQVFKDYRTPAGKELGRDLLSSLNPYISFLQECRPQSISMGNAIRYIKHEINTQLGPEKGLTEEQSKAYLLEAIDKFAQERIVLAQEAIVESATTKIVDGDVLLVHSSSSLLLQIILAAHKQGKHFRLIVVDSRPRLADEDFLKKCVGAGIKVSYCFINSLSYVMREATKVFLSAQALLANGYVMGKVGTAMVAMMSKACNVPVLVCCETYKFCERVQTDAFVFNELGDPKDLVELPNGATPKLNPAEPIPSLKLLNLSYDVTPPQLVDLVITELGMIPCTSVPVVLRIKDLAH